MSTRSTFAAFAATLVLAAGCADPAAPAATTDTKGGDSSADATTGDASTSTDAAAGTKTYKPFAFTNLENQIKRVGAYEAIQALRKGAEFAPAHFGESCAKWSPSASTASDPKKFGSLYVETASLQAKVQGRKDAHADNAGAAIGLAIDASVCSAIAAGHSTTAPRKAVHSIDWHGQVVAKSLLQFFYVSLHHYMVSGSRKGYDEGVGYYGMALDGSEPLGLAGTVASRDANCGTTYGQQLWSLLLDGRSKLDAALTKAGKTGNEDALTPLPADLAANAAEIETRLQEVFALSLGRELKELAAGKDPAIKLIEARMFWTILKPRIAAFDQNKGTQHAATFAQLAGDDPAAVKTDAILAAIKAIWGLDVVALCKT